MRAHPRPSADPSITPESWQQVLEDEYARRAWRLWAMRYEPDGTPRSPATVAQIHAAERRRCAQNPYYWLRNYLWMHDPDAPPGYQRVPVVLWPAQIRLTRFLLSALGDRRPDEPTRIRQLNKARKIGATWLALALALHHAQYEDGFSALLGSEQEKLVDGGPLHLSLFPKVRFLIQQLPAFLRPRIVRDKHLLIELDNGSVLVGQATTDTFGRSGRFALAITDEWAHVKASLQLAIKVSLSETVGSWWKISTPNERGNEFHVSWLKLPPAMKLELDWRSNPARTEEWFERLLVGNGGQLTHDERAQEHECSFAGISGERIWRFDPALNGAPPATPQQRVSRMLMAGMDFGSGPSYTALVLALVWWHEGDPVPYIHLDSLLLWQRQAADEIADDALRALDQYSDHVLIVGDPAGTAAESDQENWQARLRRNGLPVQCLPASYNSGEMIDETLRDVQRMLDRRHLTVNVKDSLLTATMESWKWDIPEGVPLDMVNRATIRPRKDAWSHPGDAIRYLVGAALRLPRQTSEHSPDGLIDDLPGSRPSVDSVYDQLIGR